MEQDSEISKIIGLKKYESPEDGFFEDFLSDFHYRQRQQLVQLSSRQLFFERVAEYFKNWSRPQLAAVTTVILLVALFLSHLLISKDSLEAPSAITHTEPSSPISTPMLVENKFVEQAGDIEFIYLDLSREPQNQDVEF